MNTTKGGVNYTIDHVTCSLTVHRSPSWLPSNYPMRMMKWCSHASGVDAKILLTRVTCLRSSFVVVCGLHARALKLRFPSRTQQIDRTLERSRSLKVPHAAFATGHMLSWFLLRPLRLFWSYVWSQSTVSTFPAIVSSDHNTACQCLCLAVKNNIARSLIQRSALVKNKANCAFYRVSWNCRFIRTHAMAKTVPSILETSHSKKSYMVSSRIAFGIGALATTDRTSHGWDCK